MVGGKDNPILDVIHDRKHWTIYVMSFCLDTVGDTSVHLAINDGRFQVTLSPLGDGSGLYFLVHFRST